MDVDAQMVSLTSDHTLDTASEVMSQLQIEQQLPNGRQSYVEMLKSLDFRNNQDGGEQHTQFVFQGQCLILGDARVGKTSLKKALLGEPIDTEEPSKKGVEITVVDREWRNLGSDESLTFGSFSRFGESSVYGGAIYGPNGSEYLYNDESPARTSEPDSQLFTSARIMWICATLGILDLSTLSVYSLWSIIIFSICLALFLQFQPWKEPKSIRILTSLVILPRYLIGFGTVYFLMGYFKVQDCDNVEFSFIGGFTLPAVTYCLQLFLWTFTSWLISVDIYYLLSRHITMLDIAPEEMESPFPGRIKGRINGPSLLHQMLPVIIGASFGFAMELTTNLLTRQYCQALYFAKIPTFCILSFGVTKTVGRLKVWKLLPVLIFMYVINEKWIVNLSSFGLLTLYAIIFAILVCYILFQQWLYTRRVIHLHVAGFFGIIIEKIVLNFEKLKNALLCSFSSLKLKLVDFPGDILHYHHIFIREHAIYIVVFNIANMTGNRKYMRKEIQRLDFWLESICSKIPPKTPIFLVGTHRGLMNRNLLKTVDKHLQQHLKHSFSDELVMNKEDNFLYFPTESTLGRSDKGIENLQKEIMSTIEEHRTTMGREMPYSWIKIQDAIISLSQKETAKFCVTLREFPVAFGTFICSNWNKETLNYFHEKGLIIYKADDKQNWILLKPLILVDVIIQLVTPPQDSKVRTQHSLRRDWKLLHDTGMLTKSLLDNIVSRVPEDGNAITVFLEEYNIICPLFYNVTKEESQVTHFVPQLLPMSTAKTPVWVDSPNDKKFYIFFNRFLPEPLFHNLLSRAHKLSKVEFPKGQPIICRDTGRFWLRCNQPYRLLQLKEEDMIEVTFSYRLVVLYMYIVTSMLFSQTIKVQSDISLHSPSNQIHPLPLSSFNQNFHNGKIKTCSKEEFCSWEMTTDMYSILTSSSLTRS